MLTAARIKAAKPRDRAYKLTDGLGLYLFVSTAGGKLWRFKYRFGGKEKLLSFGAYPEISLVDARERRDAARKQVAQGFDPGEVRRAEKAAVAMQDAFEDVAREWHSKFAFTWTAGSAAAILSRLEREVFPWVGRRAMGDLADDPPAVLAVLRRIEDGRGAHETMRKVKTSLSQIFRYAAATGRGKSDPTALLRGAFPSVEKRHHAAFTEPADVAGLLRAIDGFKGSFVVRCALQLAPLVFVRPGELRHAEWSEVDLDRGVWSISSGKMKMRQDHIVPLCRQSVGILRELFPLTGSGRYVFPGHRSPLRPLSENAVLAALRRMGFTKDEMTGHGFRAMARTILDEVLQVRPDFIEHQLAHTVRDPNGRAYNRTAHLAERRKMMQLWADYLEGLKKGAKVVMFRGK